MGPPKEPDTTFTSGLLEHSSMQSSTAASTAEWAQEGVYREAEMSGLLCCTVAESSLHCQRCKAERNEAKPCLTHRSPHLASWLGR